MTEQQLAEISRWFDRFVAGFSGETPEEQRNYDLKIDHTWRVRVFMERLADSLGLSTGNRALASAIAVCHDVGRFPQYRRYGTFNDATSVNHAALAVQTLQGEKILDSLDDETRRMLLKAVALHNAFILPEGIDAATRRFVLLIRDADKLDIWRVLIEYHSLDAGERASAVIWELPETGVCSDSALHEVINGRMINRNLLKTADDFTLLQLSWAYDLNFEESFRIFSASGYLDTLAGLLPRQDGCLQAVDAVRRHIRSRGTGT
jgi:hypothetical protein